MYKINRVNDGELKCRKYGELTFGRKQIRCCAVVASRCYIFALNVFVRALCRLRVCFYGGAFLCPNFEEKTIPDRF